MRMKFPHGDFKLYDKGQEHAYVIESTGFQNSTEV